MQKQQLLINDLRGLYFRFKEEQDPHIADEFFKILEENKTDVRIPQTGLLLTELQELLEAKHRANQKPISMKKEYEIQKLLGIAKEFDEAIDPVIKEEKRQEFTHERRKLEVAWGELKKKLAAISPDLEARLVKKPKKGETPQTKKIKETKDAQAA